MGEGGWVGGCGGGMGRGEGAAGDGSVAPYPLIHSGEDSHSVLCCLQLLFEVCHLVPVVQ